MAQDVLSQFYSCLNLPTHDKLSELARIIDQSAPNKDLQTIFPLLVSNIFGNSSSPGWSIRNVTFNTHRMEFELLHGFLEPQGPIFRLCYKLLTDPQLKYNLPLQIIPLELRYTLERGRYPQFYSDLLNVDTQSMNLISLALNPFDYYIFSFALQLLTYNAGSNDSFNSVYFTLVCDYLMHFVPSDPGVAVQPHIPHFTGKVTMMAPLQTANRCLCPTSLLLKPELSDLNNQHTTSQTESRKEIWRTETVLQVFIDIWMSVDECNKNNVDVFNRSFSSTATSTEQVRMVRILVKHIHSYSSKYLSDPAPRSAALRKYARQIMCVRAYHYVKYLVATWPLDASFRLVMELWLSLIQPWRYASGVEFMQQERFPGIDYNNHDDANMKTIDSTYTQFIAENFPSYTCIFQTILPRFMRLDLSAPKNAVMLFRLGKVFSQPYLVNILRDLELSVCVNGTDMFLGPETSGPYGNNSHVDNNMSPNKWGALAKQAISELNASIHFCYEPIWSEKRKDVLIEFLKRIKSAKVACDKTIEEYKYKLDQENKGFWSYFKFLYKLGFNDEDEMSLEEYQKIPYYLEASIHYFSHIFGMVDENLNRQEPIIEDTSLDQSSFMNSNSFPHSITSKLRNKCTDIRYMGDPDLMPITSYENTILVRILYQISTRINESYQDEFSRLWSANNFWGIISREILQKPCTIQTYVKDSTNHHNIVTHQLSARLSLRRLGTHAFVAWLIIGYVVFKCLGLSGFLYLFIVLALWILFILTKATFKAIGIVKSDLQ